MSDNNSHRRHLDSVFAGILSRRQSQNQLRRLTVTPSGAADFSSNNYLSLSSHPIIQQEFLAKLQQFSTAPATFYPSESQPKPAFNLLGSGGSRLLDGNSIQAEALEHKIAAFHHAPAGLLFNSAMDANVGLFSCVPQPDDVIVYDELIHASVHDGMRLSRARRKIPFAHNQVYSLVEKNGKREKYQSLGVILLELGKEVGHADRNIFIAVEGVYSMDGDVAPLAGIAECVERHLPNGNGYIIVDEAHSLGILGERGRGLVNQLGLEDRVWARVLGFGKAMGCSGGLVLCSPTTRLYLINYARTLIYTTAMSFPSLASTETTYDFVISGRAEPLLNHLRNLIRRTHKLLRDFVASRPLPDGLFSLPKITTSPYIAGQSVSMRAMSPIIPIFTSFPRELAAYCQRKGFMMRPIVAPTVPKGEERVRICLHAANTMAEVDGLIQAMEEWVKEVLEQGSWVRNDGQTGVPGSLQSGKGENESGKPKL